ncbi:MAG TPA: hypothetical protein V6D08_21575 [Candidatus Obscuribacterales bacterium]
MTSHVLEPPTSTVITDTVSSAGRQPARVMETAGLLERIEKFRTYGANWGTYNEAAVKPRACDRAAYFLSVFAFKHPLLALHVYPTSAGNIGIEWDWSGEEVAAIFSDTEITLLRDNGKEMKELMYTSPDKLLDDLKS